MSISADNVVAISSLVADLFDHVLVADIPDDAPYKGFLEIDQPFALSDRGYQTLYVDIIRAIFELEGVGEYWSEKGLRDQMHELLHVLAERKLESNGTPDISQVTEKWLESIDIEFEEYECFAPVIGLSTEMPFQLGEVIFTPLEHDRDRLSGFVADSFFEDLLPHRDSMAVATIKGEVRKATEILRERAEYGLNILRFFGSLVWHSEPTKHIYLAGQDRSRVAHNLALDSNGGSSRISSSEFSIVPYKVDSEFFSYANFYGFDYFQQLLDSTPVLPIEQSLLIAVQWYGDALQELVPLSSFIKHYVAIEAALKKESEPAKLTIPKRMSVLLEPWIATKQRKHESDLKDLIDERNSVFHEGKPKNDKPEFLAWAGRILSRQVLHQLRLRINSDSLETKDDLISWVDGQYNQYLSTP